MADIFGKPETLQDVLDFLGAPSQVSVQGQPSLPVTGGGAIGATEGPTTVGGEGTAPPGGDGGAPPGGGGNASNRPISAGSGWWNEIARWINPAQRFVNVAARVAKGAPESPGAPQPTTTEIEPVTPTAPPEPAAPPSGPVTVDPGELPQGPVAPTEPMPPPTDTGVRPEELPQGPVEVAPTAPTAMPSTDLGEPIPDEVVAMFGGDRPAVEAAFNTARDSVTPEMIAGMADSGDLAVYGVTSSSQLNPQLISNIQTGIAVAGLIVAGLSAAGVIDKDISMMLGSMIAMAAGAMAASVILAGGTGATAISTTIAAMPALSAVGSVASVVGLVAAPLIAWGMNKLAESMKPNLKIPARQYGAESYEMATANAVTFNEVMDTVREKGITDPNVLQALMMWGEKAILPFYMSEMEIRNRKSIGRVSSGPTGPLWQAGELEQAGHPEAWAPHRQAAQNLAALDEMLGSTYGGNPAWYAALWQGLDPSALPRWADPSQPPPPEFTAHFGERPPGREIFIESGEGGAGQTQWVWDTPEGQTWADRVRAASPEVAWSPRDYLNLAQTDPDLARQMAGGLDPLDFAIAMWSGQRPDVNPFIDQPGRPGYARMPAVPGWNPQTWDDLADAVLAAETGGAPTAPAATAPAPEPEPAPLTRRTVPLATGQPQRGGPQGERESEAFRRKK